MILPGEAMFFLAAESAEGERIIPILPAERDAGEIEFYPDIGGSALRLTHPTAVL